LWNADLIGFGQNDRMSDADLEWAMSYVSMQDDMDAFGELVSCHFDLLEPPEYCRHTEMGAVIDAHGDDYTRTFDSELLARYGFVSG